jgi:dUTP pyrophosphatase
MYPKYYWDDYKHIAIANKIKPSTWRYRVEKGEDPIEAATRQPMSSKDNLKRNVESGKLKLMESRKDEKRMKLKIKKLHPEATTPVYAKPGDSGFDLVALQDVIIPSGETRKILTGLAFEIPDGYEMQIRPRSGLTLNSQLRVQLGTIDSSYRGEVGIIVDHIFNGGDLQSIFGNDTDILIEKGMKIAQGVIAPVVRVSFEETEELSESERGDGGFGHTGI